MSRIILELPGKYPISLLKSVSNFRWKWLLDFILFPKLLDRHEITGFEIKVPSVGRFNNYHIAIVLEWRRRTNSPVWIFGTVAQNLGYSGQSLLDIECDSRFGIGLMVFRRTNPLAVGHFRHCPVNRFVTTGSSVHSIRKSRSCILLGRQSCGAKEGATCATLQLGLSVVCFALDFFAIVEQ